MALLHIGCISPSTQRQTQAASAELRNVVRRAQMHAIRTMAPPNPFSHATACRGRCKPMVAENKRHCFGPVIYNENTNYDVRSRKAPFPSMATMV
jgi:hypothetical protein